MATFGLLPPKICPIIVPGRATNPITEMFAISGLKDLMMAWRMKGACASAFVVTIAEKIPVSMLFPFQSTIIGVEAMTLLDSMLPISMPKIGMKYRALNTFSTLSTIPIKYKPTHTTLHKKPADMGRSRIFLFNCVRANAVCDATNNHDNYPIESLSTGYPIKRGSSSICR